MNNENNFFAIRGKSDRRRKRDKVKQKEKQHIQFYKKQRALNQLKWNLGYEELEKPYQVGFKRFFVLRDDIALTKHADYYNELLTYINTTQKSLRKDFKKRKRIKRKKVYVESEQFLKSLFGYEFKKVPEKFRMHFVTVEIFNLKTKCTEIRNIYIEPWRFVLKVEPNMITHQKRTDAQLESEIAQLDKHIERNNLRPKMNKARSKRTKWHWDCINEKHKPIPIYKFLKQNNEQH